MKKIQDILRKQIKLWQIIALILSLPACHLSFKLINWIIYLKRKSNLLQISKKYLQKRDNDLLSQEILQLKLSKQYTEEEIENILNKDVQYLKQLLNEKKVTSEDLLIIFAKRSATIGKDLNLITEHNFEEALVIARDCDYKRINTPQLCKGELFGIPISIKDTFEQKGFPSSFGCIIKLKKLYQDDGLPVKILKLAGAIPFIRSNIPQAAMTYESFNHIYQRAENPWNRSRSVGGSSGGEAGLIAARCSPLGIGSDIAGSIRIPSAFCGVYGLKPSSARVYVKGHAKLHIIEDGQIDIPISIGPIGKSIQDLADMCRALFKQEYYKLLPLSQTQPYFLPKNFDEEKFLNYSNEKKKLRIGYYKSLDYIDACVSSQRAVEIAKAALEKKGHTLIEIKMPNIEKVVSTFYQVFGSYYRDLFDQFFIQNGEPVIKEYQTSYYILKMGKLLRKIACFILNKTGEKRAANCIQSLKKCSSLNLRINVADILKLQEMYLKVWEDNQIDAILSPGFSLPTIKHTYSQDMGNDFTIYTFIYNLLDYCCGIVPVTKVQEQEQHYDNCKIKDMFTQPAKNSMKDTLGLPITVQIATLPFQEEICLHIMNLIDEETQFYKNNSFPVIAEKK